MTFPEPYTLGVKRRRTGTKDTRNNPVITYDDPHDWAVYGYHSGANTDPGLPNRDMSLILWTVYSDVTDEAPGELDRVVLNGAEYDVEGRPVDYSNGPWNFPGAGLVVELKRAEG